MPKATIEVQYVNEPQEGRKSGSVKDATGTYYYVWPDMLPKFEIGKTYEIMFEDSVSKSNGRTYHTVKTVTPVNGATNGAGASWGKSKPSTGNGTYRETSARDAERMFVCSILNASIQAGKVEFNGAELKRAVIGLRSVWAETFGENEK